MNVSTHLCALSTLRSSVDVLLRLPRLPVELCLRIACVFNFWFCRAFSSLHIAPRISMQGDNQSTRSSRIHGSNGLRRSAMCSPMLRQACPVQHRHKRRQFRPGFAASLPLQTAGEGRDFCHFHHNQPGIAKTELPTCLLLRSSETCRMHIDIFSSCSCSCPRSSSKRPTAKQESGPVRPRYPTNHTMRVPTGTTESLPPPLLARLGTSTKQAPSVPQDMGRACRTEAVKIG